MIISYLSGGLGNQMFQYATARRVAEKNNAELKLDLSWFNSKRSKNPPRPYKLDVFDISGTPASHSDLAKVGIHTGLLHRIFRKFKLYSPKVYKKEKYVDVYPFCLLTEEALDYGDNVYLEGYWQYEEYFYDIAEIIEKEFTLKKQLSDCGSQLLEKISSDPNSVSLHIRRGDYGKLNLVLPLDYYDRAIKIIRAKIKEPTFYIFSDDIGWVKENLKLESPAVFVEGKSVKDYEEIYLMSRCGHHIMANSSFSWWGAWLNSNRNTLCIRPKDFFGPEPEEVRFLKFKAV